MSHMKILVTAGPTREPIDPVRFIGNRSSGKMGYALAKSAVARGHDVRLISGPVSLQAPEKARVFNVLTAMEMLAAVTGNVEWCDALIMAAAVCDWRPSVVSGEKIKKDKDASSLPMTRNPDILGSVSQVKGQRIFIGFAAETGNPVAEGYRKLAAKNLDLIVANDVSRTDAGFETDMNQVYLIDGSGIVRHTPLITKDAVAEEIISWLEARAHVSPRSF